MKIIKDWNEIFLLNSNYTVLINYYANWLWVSGKDRDGKDFSINEHHGGYVLQRVAFEFKEEPSMELIEKTLLDYVNSGEKARNYIINLDSLSYQHYIIPPQKYNYKELIRND